MALHRKSKKIAQKLWRPDFRDVQSLPDTKAIRTGFLTNFIAIALTLMVLTLYLVREYSLQSMKSNVVSLASQVEGSTARNKVILQKNKEFLQQSQIAAEVVAFDSQVIDFAAFIREVSEKLPSGVLLSRLELHYPKANNPVKSKIPPLLADLTGRINQMSDGTPSQVLTDYQKAIRVIPSLEQKTVGMDLTRFSRNNEFGFFDFTLQVSISAQSQTSP